MVKEDLCKIRGETDWERLRSMTDQEIEAAAKADEDAQPTDAQFWEDAVWSPPLTFLD